MRYDSEVALAAAHWAGHYGVAIDTALIHAIIEQESTHGLSLEAAEPGGHRSYGPMMVKDSTASSVLGVVDPASLKDPKRGIWYGVQYFAQMLRRFSGDVAAAIAAYNAGPGNARRNARGQFPNQRYVNRVLGFWRQFKVLAAASAPGLGLLAIAAVAWLVIRQLRMRKRAA